MAASKSQCLSPITPRLGCTTSSLAACRAVVLPPFGAPEVLELRPIVDVPDLKPNEVLVSTRAVSINPLDTKSTGGPSIMRADSEGLHEIRRLSEARKLNIPVEKTFPITQVIEAHEAKEKKQIYGKVVLELD